LKALEVSKNNQRRVSEGFYSKYCRGVGLDIGYRGFTNADIEPVLPSAIGVDLDFAGYDGKNLPFRSLSKSYVWAGHVLEHIEDYRTALNEWMRVLHHGGHLIILVPHAFLYDKSLRQFDIWHTCPDHKRLYTPASLLSEIEHVLAPNSYRIVHMKDNDYGYDYGQKLYDIPDYNNDCFEIELVLQKIRRPDWQVKGWCLTEAKSIEAPPRFIALWRIFWARLRRLKNKICN